MAIYSKSELEEQVEVIHTIKTLLTLTVLKLTLTNRQLTDATKILKRIEEALSRVFEIHPGAAIDNLNKKKLKKKHGGNEKKLMVLISANERLYGDIVSKICKYFISDLKASNNDALVIGQVGKQLLSEENITSKVYYFDLDDYKPDPLVVRQILGVINQYDKVVVYHGQNDTLLKQIAVKSDVALQVPEMVKPSRRYIFEPTILDVLNFLNSQVVVNTFSQKIYSNEVARLSARRWSWTKEQMARAEYIEDLNTDYQKYKKQFRQKQQQVNVSSLRISEEQQVIKSW